MSGSAETTPGPPSDKRGGGDVTRYIPAFSWPDHIQKFLEEVVTEKPLLHVCAGTRTWGDTTVDLTEAADLNADWRHLPFPPDSYGAVFADPPWNHAYKRACATFVRRALRIAPVVYVMAPWIRCSADTTRRYWVRELPGLNTPIILTRYARSEAWSPNT